MDNIANRAKQWLFIMEALAVTVLGQQKESLINTYKASIRSLCTYTASIWFPNTAPSNISRLQRVQDAVAHIATGSIKLSAKSYHTEAKMLPVQDHLSLLSCQHLSTYLQLVHPLYPMVTAYPRPRDMKKTLHSPVQVSSPNPAHLCQLSNSRRKGGQKYCTLAYSLAPQPPTPCYH